MLEDLRDIPGFAADDFKDKWPELSCEISEWAERLRTILIRIVDDVQERWSLTDEGTENRDFIVFGDCGLEEASIVFASLAFPFCYVSEFV